MNKLYQIIIFTTLLLLNTTVNAITPYEWGSCYSAIKDYCADVPQKDKDAMVSCLSKNKRHLKSSCKNTVERIKEKRKQIKKYENDHISECAKEEARFCRGVEPGNGRLKACLRLHKHQLGKKCNQALKDKSIFY